MKRIFFTLAIIFLFCSNAYATILYGSGNGFFGTIDPTAGTSTTINPFWGDVDIAFGPNGTLYGSGTGFFGTIDPTVGTSTTINPFWGDVDIAFSPNGTLYGSGTGFFGTIDPTAGTSTTINPFWGDVDIAFSPKPVPEPATMLLLGAGLIGAIGLRRRS